MHFTATALLTLISVFTPAWAYSQNPKVYYQFDIIDRVVPLKHGFVVFLRQEMMRSQLDPDQVPTIYATAAPLEEHEPTARDIYYKLRQTNVKLQGLADDSWYFVCIEFENQHREQRRGNFSTHCQIHKTLDKFGKHDLNMTSFVEWVSVLDTRLEARMEIDVNFPVEVGFYLENFPLVHTYYASQRKSLQVSFVNLEPNSNYGDVCAYTQPLTTAYTGMGRIIRQSIKTCFRGTARSTSPMQGVYRSVALKSIPVPTERQETPTAGTQSRDIFGCYATLWCAMLFWYLF